MTELPFGGKLAVDMRVADQVREAMMGALNRLELDREQGLSAALGGLALVLDSVDVTDEELEGILQAIATLREALADGDDAAGHAALH